MIKTFVDLSIFLSIILLFIVFVLRAFYFALIAKIDPIKTIMPAIPYFNKALKKAESNAKLQGMS